MPSKPIIPRVCQQCGTTFLARQSAINGGGALYCGMACQVSARRKNPAPGEPGYLRICAFCKRSFPPRTLNRRPVYCSVPCARKGRWPERAERFWSKVDRSGGPDACWPWVGPRFDLKHYQPYGAFWDGDNNRGAHQVAWELANGQPFPDGKQGNHTCDFGLCCNPSHVIPGTQSDNMQDMVRKGRHRYGHSRHLFP
jgi:hypothetical protein